MHHTNGVTRRGALLAGGAAALAGATAGRVRAQAKPIRVGVLTDLAGIVSDATGRGSVEAARMAVEEMGGSVLGRPVEVLAADHQHKADIGAGITRQWLDEGVDAIADVPNSGVALAVQQLARERQRIALFSSPGTTVLTNAQCSPTGFAWTFDTYAIAHGTASALVQDGGTTWFLIVADYAFGDALERDITAVVTALGGKVLGSARHALGASDYSSQLLQAQSSGAKVVCACNAGADTVNVLKQANEFGLTAKQRLATTVFTISDVHGMGLKAAQGALVTEAFYWDRDEGTRAWSRRFFDRIGRMPSQYQIGTYEAVRHWLLAMKAAGTDQGLQVAKAMREMPIESAWTHGARIRADGRVLRPMLLEQVKSPAESKAPWDYMLVRKVIPVDQVVWPPSESKCPALKA